MCIRDSRKAQPGPWWERLRRRLIDHGRDLYALFDDDALCREALPPALHSGAPADHPMPAEVAPEVCTSCHDGDRDGGRFDPAVYRPKVLHGGGG